LVQRAPPSAPTPHQATNTSPSTTAASATANAGGLEGFFLNNLGGILGGGGAGGQGAQGIQQLVQQVIGGLGGRSNIIGTSTTVIIFWFHFISLSLTFQPYQKILFLEILFIVITRHSDYFEKEI